MLAKSDSWEPEWVEDQSQNDTAIRPIVTKPTLIQDGAASLNLARIGAWLAVFCPVLPNGGVEILSG